RIEPTNCWRTLGATSGGSGLTSRVTTGRSGSAAASRAISPWPIWPEAPVMRTEGLRDTHYLFEKTKQEGQIRNPKHEIRKKGPSQTEPERGSALLYSFRISDFGFRIWP